MKYGIHYIYWQKDLPCGSYLPFLPRAKKAGFDVLELGDYLVFDLSEAQMTELASAARDLDLELLLGLDPPQDKSLTALDPAVREAGIAFYAEGLRRAKKLGMRMLGGHFLNARPAGPDAQMHDREWALGLDSVRKICDIALDAGMQLNLEAVNRFQSHLLTTSAETCRFVDELDRPNAKVLLDSFHMNIEESSMFHAILTAGKRLGHFHMVENHRGLPGTGHIDWAGVRDALQAIGYDGIVSMEALVRYGGNLGDCANIWRDLTGNADDEQLDREAAASLASMRNLFANGRR